MEDVSMVAQIEGFKHEQLLFVDEVLKQLGEYQPTKKKSRTQSVASKATPLHYAGSALATEAGKCRPPVLPSAHTIQQ